MKRAFSLVLIVAGSTLFATLGACGGDDEVVGDDAGTIPSSSGSLSSTGGNGNGSSSGTNATSSSSSGSPASSSSSSSGAANDDAGTDASVTEDAGDDGGVVADPIDAVCQEQAACDEDFDLDGCKGQLGEQRDDAATANCQAQFTALMQCAVSVQYTCDDDFDDLVDDACGDQQDALDDCEF